MKGFSQGSVECGPQVESEVRGGYCSSMGLVQLTLLWASGWTGGGAGREQSRGCVPQAPEPSLCPVAGPRPQSGGEPLPCLLLWDIIAAAICMGYILQDLGPLTDVWVAWRVWGPVVSWAPGFLSDDCCSGSGDLALRELLAESYLFSTGGRTQTGWWTNAPG